MVIDVSRGLNDDKLGGSQRRAWTRVVMGIDVFLFATRHLLVVCTQTCNFRCCIVFEAVVCRLYEMLYPCICNVVISCWKSGAYDFVICRGGTDMCFVPGSGWKHLDLEQYRISGLTSITGGKE